MIVFRKVEERDLPLIERMIEADADHIGKMHADFFNNTRSICVEDKEGPAMFLRFDPEPEKATVRCHIQFHEDQEYRTCRVLMRGFPHVARGLYQSGASRMVFETVNPKLSDFWERAYGFKRVKDTNDWELYLLGERELAQQRCD